MQPNADDALLPQHQQPEDAPSLEKKQPIYIVIMEKKLESTIVYWGHIELYKLYRDIVPLKLQSKGHRMASWPLMTRPWKAKKCSHRFLVPQKQSHAEGTHVFEGPINWMHC